MFFSLYDILTIGIPFGLFKLLSGIYYNLNFLIWWGLLDIAINLLNFILISIKKKKVLPTCSLAMLGFFLGKNFKIKTELTEDTGESLDVLFSFLIIAIVIGSGAIASFSPHMLLLWNISVILNIMGAGSIRLFNSIKRYRTDLN
tara:strand:- start:814 stop:1248 length:435 start_codon:yes stop_codon:yes gene_type:complete